MTPQRIQLRRTKGWRKPENTVVVARPSKWGNPFRVVDGTAPVGDIFKVWGRYANGRVNQAAAREAVDRYRRLLRGEMVYTLYGCRPPHDAPLQPRTLGYEGTSAGSFAPRWPLTARYEAPFTHDLIRSELGGKNLACWCPLDQPCHADVLLELANPESLTACPARAVATPHQVSAPGVGALPGSPTPPRVEPGSPNECEGP
jgi:hypothetical protein